MIVVFCGLPASGKTTLSTQLANEYKIKLYQYDEFKKDLKSQNSRQIHQRLYSLIVEDLLTGCDVMLDDLYTCLEWRRSLLETIKDIPCKKILIVMTTPFEECIRRNSQRQGQSRLPDFIIKHLHGRYQPPSLDEGWDDILFI